MSDRVNTLNIDLEYESRYRYLCNSCQRAFVVMSRRIHESGAARCPNCSSDDVGRRLSRRERITSFLMMYEAA